MVAPLNTRDVQTDEASESECLVCLIDGVRISVPLLQIDGIADYEQVPLPPIAEDWVAGIGLLGEKIFLAVAFYKKSAAQPAQTHKAVLMKRPGSSIRWALEVDEVAGLGTAEPTRGMFAPNSNWRIPEAWLLSAKDGLGADARWLDIDAVTSALAGAA